MLIWSAMQIPSRLLAVLEVITRRHSVIARVEGRDQHSYELNASYEVDSRN